MLRLDVLRTEQRLAVRLKFMMIRLFSGREAPDVMRALHYRQERFGQPFSNLLQAVMRGPSEWSIGDRELFAAFVSHQNQCKF